MFKEGSSEFIETVDLAAVPSAQEVSKPKNIFLEQAEVANPEIESLKKELTEKTRQIGAIKELMKTGSYPGRPMDLSVLERTRDALVEKINKHPDRSTRTGFDKLAGSREEAVFRKIN